LRPAKSTVSSTVEYYISIVPMCFKPTIDVCAVVFGEGARQYSTIEKLQLFVAFTATILQRTT